MKPIVAALLAGASVSASAGTVYYVDVVNNDASSVIAVDAAPAGSTHFAAVLRGSDALATGFGATLALRAAGDGCRRDLRITFADGRVATKHGVNLCALRR